MPLVPAICTQCGANIEVDNTHEAGICKFCGTAFITERVINTYNITNNITASVVNIYNESKADDFETNGRTLIVYKGNDQEVHIPEYITEIGEDAFRDNKTIRKVVVPSSVKVIGNRAFLECENLSEVILPDSMWSLDAYGIFRNCKSLRKIKMPNDIGIIGQSMFTNCEKLEEFVIPNSVHTIKESAFEKCTSLKHVVIPKSVKKMGWLIFSECNLDSITFENSANIQEIGRGIFSKSKKTPLINAPESFINKYKAEFDVHQNILDSTAYESNNATSSSGGCYIATCVYGSYDCPEVWTLRRFRDYTLDETFFGKIFIKCYYAISPSLVKWFGEQKWFKSFWKKHLDKMIDRLNKNGVENTRYTDKY